MKVNIPRYVWVSDMFDVIRLLDIEENRFVAYISIFCDFTKVEFADAENDNQSERFSKEYPITKLKEYVEMKLDIPHCDVGTYKEDK